MFTSKHHDGFTNWPSTYTFGWNSQDIGPNRDVVGELKQAFQRHPDLHFGLYYSLYEWFNPMYLEDKKNNYKTRCESPQKCLADNSSIEIFKTIFYFTKKKFKKLKCCPSI